MRCFLWVWTDMGLDLHVDHLGCLHFVSPNMQISFISGKWCLSLLSDLLWGQNSHKHPYYFKAIGINDINKKSYRNLFLLNHQHLAKLWSWRLQVSQPALSLNPGLHLQECRCNRGPSMTARLWSEQSSFTYLLQLLTCVSPTVFIYLFFCFFFVCLFVCFFFNFILFLNFT